MAARIRDSIYRAERSVPKPEPVQVDPLVQLTETFGEEVTLLLDLMSNCTKRTPYRDLKRIELRWTCKKPKFLGLKERLDKWCGEHYISGADSYRYRQEALYGDTRWEWFKKYLLPRGWKAATKAGKKYRSKANKIDNERRVARETPDEHETRLQTNRDYRKRVAEELNQARLEVGCRILAIEGILAQPFKPPSESYQSREDWEQELSQLKKSLGKTLKRTLAQLRGV
jgi:hypothetical protein